MTDPLAQLSKVGVSIWLTGRDGHGHCMEW
jgi:hypothetical protein